LEEWNSIPEDIIKKAGLNYIKRLKKVLKFGAQY